MNDQALVPAIIQDHQTGEVLMLAYMNDESLQLTLDTGYTWFWSRSRQKLWNKGETSGNLQKVKELRFDCDEDTYVVLVEQIGGIACHTGQRSCFYRQMWPDKKEVSEAPIFASKGPARGFLVDLESVIQDRQEKLPSDSYTAELFKAGQERILEKIEEESEELVRAARSETTDRVVSESADLLYHMMVLLAQRQMAMKDVVAELQKRRA